MYHCQQRWSRVFPHLSVSFPATVPPFSLSLSFLILRLYFLSKSPDTVPAAIPYPVAHSILLNFKSALFPSLRILRPAFED